MDSKKIEDILTFSLKILFTFLKNIFGTINSPYKTYLVLVKKGKPIEGFLILGLVVIYLAWASLVRTGVHSNPFILTLNFTKLLASFLWTFLLSIGGLYFLGKIFGGQGPLKGIFLTWSFSLIPTLSWFLLTSILYLLLPPPRTTSLLGQAFSIFFIAFSLTLFFWKGLLYYLTLRFGMRLNLLRIAGVSTVFFPTLGLYSLLMYRLGVFRIPFV